jgi:hypothetical protein
LKLDLELVQHATGALLADLDRLSAKPLREEGFGASPVDTKPLRLTLQRA